MHQLGRERTALIVVDMQNGFCSPEGSLTQMGKDTTMCVAAVAPCRRLVEAAHGAGVPVIYTRIVYRADYADRGLMPHEIRPALKDLKACVDGTWDAELVPEFVPEARDHVFDKNRPSAFYNCGMESALRSLDMKTLVICGVTTNICVESTVRDAGQRDYRTFVVADATGELEQDRHDAALKSMAYFFAHLVTVADVVAAWAGDDQAQVTGDP
jgi:ureidoacrylate peracid hydrolase